MSHPKVAVLAGDGGLKGRWLVPFLPEGAAARYDFVFVPAPAPQGSWHERGGTTTLGGWRAAFAHARRGLRTRPDVLVTTFPPTALAACVLKRLFGAKTKIVAWTFNLGATDNPAKGRGAGAFLRAADAIVVHSREEVERYRAFFGLPEGIVRFVPLQQGDIRIPRKEAQPPFALAMGTAHRDYRALFEAARGWDGRLVVVAGPSATAGLDVPDNVALHSGLTLEECRALNAEARFAVVPVDNDETASGQVTVIQSMALGVPVIATDCLGTRDYLTDEADGLLVPPRDAEALRRAMTRLDGDDRLRARLGDAAKTTWRQRFSDEAAGRAFGEVLAEVSPTHPSAAAGESKGVEL